MSGSESGDEPPMAGTEDVEPVADVASWGGDGNGAGWLERLEQLELDETKGGEERRAREAGERRAAWEAEYQSAEQAAAQRMAREAKEREARWRAEDERVARAAEEWR